MFRVEVYVEMMKIPRGFNSLSMIDLFSQSWYDWVYQMNLGFLEKLWLKKGSEYFFSKELWVEFLYTWWEFSNYHGIIV